MVECFEIERREEAGVLFGEEEDGWYRGKVIPYEGTLAQSIVAEGHGRTLVHRTVYVWTGEWKPAT